MRLLISTLFVAGFAVSSALADGMSKADVAAAKGGLPVAQAHASKLDAGVPKNQSSVVVSVERGVRVWRPLVEAPDYGGGYEVVAPRSASAEPQYYGNGYYNGGGYGGGYIGNGFGSGSAVAQQDRYANFVGSGGGQGVVRDKRDGGSKNQLFVRDPHKRMNFERGNRYDGGNRHQYSQRGDRQLPQVHRHAEAPRMSPRDGGGRNMGPGPKMARPQMAQRPVQMARPQAQMAGPRMMMGGPKMHARPMARPMMKRMGGGRRH
jgi:hypothetical protein